MFVLGTTNLAHADGFISPFIGYSFGGDSGCPEIANCNTKTRNIGLGIGSLGSVFGGEFEFNFIDQFFGQTAGVSSNRCFFSSPSVSSSQTDLTQTGAMTIM